MVFAISSIKAYMLDQELESELVLQEGDENKTRGGNESWIDKKIASIHYYKLVSSKKKYNAKEYGSSPPCLWEYASTPVAFLGRVIIIIYGGIRPW